MKVVLDEMLPAAVVDLLFGHDVVSVKAAGYTGLANGVLLRRAAVDGYDILLTADRNLPAQQNAPAGSIAVLLVRGSQMVDIEPQVFGFEPQSPEPCREPSRGSRPMDHAGENVKARYDRQHDVAYGEFSTAVSDQQVALDDARIIDYAADGFVVGVEFFSPSRGVNLAGVRRAANTGREVRRLGLPIRTSPADVVRPS